MFLLQLKGETAVAREEQEPPPRLCPVAVSNLAIDRCHRSLLLIVVIDRVSSALLCQAVQLAEPE